MINRITIFLAATLFCAISFAQVDIAKPASLAVIKSKLVADVRVIIDISGSMKQNDPKNLRRPALELLVHLFPEGAKAGVWTFGQWVNMLVAHREVDADWRAKALASAGSINSVALRTNIADALIKAVDDINNLDPAYETHVILLTDGMVDVSESAQKNSEARERILNEILPAFSAADVTVHTVALSKNADSQLLERLSVETNGLFAVAETAEDLTKIFLQAFDAAAPAEQVPLQGNRFLIDASIDEFTALLFSMGMDGSILVAPDGKQYSADNHGKNIKWHRQQNYDLITVTNPQKGEWSLIAELEPDSRVTIVSNLSLQVNTLPKSVFTSGDTSLTAVLKDQDVTIKNANFLNLVEMSVVVERREDATSWDLSLSERDRSPPRGIFSSPLTMLTEVGNYQVVVSAVGKTFSRQYTQTLAVYETFEVTTTSNSEGENPVLRLFAKNPAVDADKTKVVVRVKDPSGASKMQMAAISGARTWSMELEDIVAPGIYQLTVEATGRYVNGDLFEYTSAIFPIEHNMAALPTAEVEVVAEQPVVVDPKPPTKKPQQTTPEPEPTSADESFTTEDMVLYAGLALGNILLIVMGYFAYKTVKSSGRLLIDEDEDEDDDDDDEADEEFVMEEVVEPEMDADDEPVVEETVEEVVEQEAEVEAEVEAELDIDDFLEDMEDELSKPDSEPEEIELEETASQPEIEQAESEPEAEVTEPKPEPEAVDELNLDDLDLDLDLDLDMEDEAELEEDEIISLDDIDDILDLPDDVIDISPSSDDK